MSILLLSTGGTIGALPYDDPARAPKLSSFSKDRDFVREALASPPFDKIAVRYMALEQRDSKLIDDDYLENLANVIFAAVEKRVLVTHGTDAILSSAEFLHRKPRDRAALKDKIIVLTGSMIPLANGPESDGYKNLFFGLAWLRDAAAPGVNIVLCDYENAETESGAWMPRLYSYEPGVYEKQYGADTRYSRIRRKA